MPCAVKLQVHKARGLGYDRDEDGRYVEVSLHDHVQFSTRSSGPPDCPVWNDSITLELTDDFALQDYPLRLGVCSGEGGPPDHGAVSIDLEQILHSRGGSAEDMDADSIVSMQGWFPLFDTMSGVRGQILVSVKMQFVGDQSYNDRVTSSVGVRFFSIATPPQPNTLAVEFLFGLVEELKVVQDPEYHWRDYIRSNRSSNEERLHVFHTSAMQARRQLGKKVLQLGANAVLGYREYVDLEGDKTDRLCIRAHGTAALLGTPLGGASIQVSPLSPQLPFTRPPASPGAAKVTDMTADETFGIGASSSLRRGFLPPLAPALVRATSDSPSGGCARDRDFDQSLMRRGTFHTLDRLPIDVQIAFGGVVAARAVKVFSSRTTQDSREAWWTELREELLSHANALGGDTIAGYREHISIYDGVAMLSAMGTDT